MFDTCLLSTEGNRADKPVIVCMTRGRWEPEMWYAGRRRDGCDGRGLSAFVGQRKCLMGCADEPMLSTDDPSLVPGGALCRSHTVMVARIWLCNSFGVVTVLAALIWFCFGSLWLAVEVWSG